VKHLIQLPNTRRTLPPLEEDGGNLWTAICDTFNLAGCGETEEEAQSALDGAIMSFCRALRRRGLLEVALDEMGIVYEPADDNMMVV